MGRHPVAVRDHAYSQGRVHCIFSMWKVQDRLERLFLPTGSPPTILDDGGSDHIWCASHPEAPREFRIPVSSY